MALSRATLRDLVRIWPAFDVNRLAKTWPAVEMALLKIIQTRGRASSALAAKYYRALRKENGITDTFDPVLANVPEQVIRDGLQYVGPVLTGIALSKGRPADLVAQARFVDLSGTSTRYVTKHGRETIMQTIQADDRASGWRRVTSGKACSFCASLASQGVVPKETSVDFKAHNHCSCGAEPAYL